MSLSKPHVRPIVRGKASVDVEFGAKLPVSVIEGAYVFFNKKGWGFDEGCFEKVGNISFVFKSSTKNIFLIVGELKKVGSSGKKVERWRL